MSENDESSKAEPAKYASDKPPAPFSDSGYAESFEDEEAIDDTQDHEIRPDIYAVNGEFVETHKGHRRSPSLIAQKQALAQVTQLQYNNNRIALGRLISQVQRLLKELQRMNRSWPIYYPSVESRQKYTRNPDKRPVNEDIMAVDLDSDEEPPIVNLETAPRLVTPQVTKGFNVFKLDLKLGSLSSDELVHQLEKSSVASLLEEKISQTLKHLQALRERIDDTSSKVLITGDLNAGKSTFCNALLRRSLLPTDQQPCTNVFCEVLDCGDNNGVEEVHAVHLGRDYDRLDESSYEIHKLEELEDLVLELEKYSILKVYVDDRRPMDHSLLRNGVVDISLIDAPGLNKDSYQTTQVFSRQEEIDLVVFVVSAENHFTLSAKEFITTAAHEKSFIFIVVNRFDTIKDKSRCMKRILDQVADLAPETHKDARDFVHFVSSEDVLANMPSSSKNPGGPGGPGGGDDGPGGGDDDEGGDPDFDRLEESLRNFVLEKRSLSKLAPAKTYLGNILHDLETLADVNVKVTGGERDKLLEDLDGLAPKFDECIASSAKVSEQVDKEIDKLTNRVYDTTTERLNQVIQETGETPVVPYQSVMESIKYAQLTRQEIINRIQQEVYACEEAARLDTVSGVNAIKNLGIMHLGNHSAFDKVFKSEAMFSKRRDNLARAIIADLSISDFVDISIPHLLPEPKTSDSKEVAVVTTVNNALTLASVVGGGQLIRNSSWIRHAFSALGWVDYGTVKKLVVPAITVATLAGIAYVIMDIPNAVPRKVSRKVRHEIEAMGYVHSNALRISRECEKVLKYPAQDIRTLFQTDIEQQARKKEEYAKRAEEAEKGYKYFTQLQKDAKGQRALVEMCNLEVNN
ncbi:mitofusin Fzo1p [Trichomonascus vanleenenianus]|uniref:mitofusin n=1 Tax=Trichomonascus vanleenenianus TaxID=2268995 RepID=UPI003ECB9E6D